MQFQLREYPQRVRIKQDKPGAYNCVIVDADTDKTLNAVLAIEISRENGSLITLTMPAHEPFKATANRDESDASFEDYKGVLSQRVSYAIASLRIETM